MNAPSSSSSSSIKRTTESQGNDESWISYSDMDSTKYNGMLTCMALTSSLLLQPLNVITTRQQAGSLVTGDKKSATVIGALLRYRQELGWRGLFRGWLPIATMGVPSQIVYLSITESSREILQKYIKRVLPTASSATVDTLQSSATALLANMVSLIPYVPADVISSRMVIQPAKGIGMTSMVKLIYNEGAGAAFGGRGGYVGGLQGFYRGFNISLCYGVMLSAGWWGCYSISRREFSKVDAIKSSPVLLDGLTGLVAGLISTCVAHPLDTIKTRIMTGTRANMPVLATIRYVVAKEGTKALWKGLPAAMYQGALSSCGFALSYEVIKRCCTNPPPLSR